MSYLCISDDCSLVPVRDTNRTLKNEQSYNQQEPHEMNVNEEFIIPDYVCCVLTEDVWTIFGACALIISLFTIATLKYFKKYLAKTRYNKKNLRMKDRLVKLLNLSLVFFTSYSPVDTNTIFNLNTVFQF